MISSSPNRNSFQLERYLERRLAEGKTYENDEDVKVTVDFHRQHENQTLEKESDPEWQKNNLEYDLRTTDWVLEKARKNESYAQNLYAAMCNNDFVKNDVWPILQGQTWSCSWRYAGGIVANMRQEGDYIEWYCSGIREFPDIEPNVRDHYVSESTVTDEIRQDLLKLGWIVVDTDDCE